MFALVLSVHLEILAFGVLAGAAQAATLFGTTTVEGSGEAAFQAFGVHGIENTYASAGGGVLLPRPKRRTAGRPSTPSGRRLGDRKTA